jgi:hypothetical protein
MHYFFHHLNDFSGSPRIINEKIKAYNELGEEVLIITNNDYGFIDTGFLPHKYLPYSKSNSKLIKVIRLFFWWVRASLLVMAAVRKHDTVHASTLINAPILMSARLKQAKTCIHVMEYAISPKPLKSLLRFFARNFVDYYIYLSRFLMDVDPINKYGKVQITYPAVDGIISKAGSISYRERTLHPSNKNRVCMVCSLVWYKGGTGNILPSPD